MTSVGHVGVIQGSEDLGLIDEFAEIADGDDANESFEIEARDAQLPFWELSCQDWWQRLQRGQSLVPGGLPIDQARGARAVAIFDMLRLADVHGQPRAKDAVGDWFRMVVRVLFGSVDNITRQRALREIFILVSKKQGKTSCSALLMLTALLMNDRPQAPFILTAPMQDVTQKAFEMIEGAIAADNVLKKKLHVRGHQKEIEHRLTGAILSVMTFEPKVLTGQKVVGCLVDELHVCAKMPRAASAIGQLRGGMLPYPEAFLMMITTQSEEAPAGVFKAELQKARAIRDGKAQGRMLPILYEFPEAVQRSKSRIWRNPKLWRLITPAAGQAITIGRLKEEFDEAEGKGEPELRRWASQHLNIEVGMALHWDRWVAVDYWEDQLDPKGVTLERILTECEVITVGIDGGGLQDFLAVTVTGRLPNPKAAAMKVDPTTKSAVPAPATPKSPEQFDEATHIPGDDGKNWITWTRAWVHESVKDTYPSEAGRFEDFEKAGDLIVVKGDKAARNIDIVGVADICSRVFKSKKLHLIGVDPAGISDIVEAIVARGVPREKIFGVRQGWQMVMPMRTVERKLSSGRLFHGGQGLMAWSMSNAKLEKAGNAYYITKQVSGFAKIDNVLSLLDSISLMAGNPAAPLANTVQLFTLG